MSFDLLLDNSGAIVIDIADAELKLYPQVFSVTEADYYFTQLLETIDWQQDKIELYGKIHDVPRLTAWYGDDEYRYEYSGIHAVAKPWTNWKKKKNNTNNKKETHDTNELLSIKSRVEQATGLAFNSVLLNLYRNGKDGVAWHCDDESELGTNPLIASVSLGQERKFQLKHKYKTSLKKEFTLPHGSVLLMGHNMQKYWLHQIPKTSKTISARINLTFRQIIK